MQEEVGQEFTQYVDNGQTAELYFLSVGKHNVIITTSEIKQMTF